MNPRRTVVLRGIRSSFPCPNEVRRACAAGRLGRIGHAGWVTDLPTTPLPLPGQAGKPPAWEDATTRRTVNRTLWIALLLLLVGGVAVGASVALVRLDQLDRSWGLGVLVGIAGVAGGALAGGVTMLVLWARTRSLLRRGPWVPGELTLGEGRDAEIVFGRSVAPVRMEIRTAVFGDPGTRLDVEVRSEGDRLLVTVPPSRRLLRATPAW
ncbi:MAG TPA: hypothetical protein GXZ30_12195 [Propionibacterium sp.]|nr:hypothetical protein [Propionibacterium sp.]